jgi:hypothetical protein
MHVGGYLKQARMTSTLTIYGKNITGTRHAKVERYSCIASNIATGAFTNSEFTVEFAGKHAMVLVSYSEGLFQRCCFAWCSFHAEGNNHLPSQNAELQP